MENGLIRVLVGKRKMLKREIKFIVFSGLNYEEATAAPKAYSQCEKWHKDGSIENDEGRKKLLLHHNYLDIWKMSFPFFAMNHFLFLWTRFARFIVVLHLFRNFIKFCQLFSLRITLRHFSLLFFHFRAFVVVRSRYIYIRSRHDV